MFSFTEVHVVSVCECVCMSVSVLSQLVEKSIVLIDELKRVVAGGRGVTLSIRYVGRGGRLLSRTNSTRLI